MNIFGTYKIYASFGEGNRYYEWFFFYYIPTQHNIILYTHTYPDSSASRLVVCVFTIRRILSYLGKLLWRRRRAPP